MIQTIHDARAPAQTARGVTEPVELPHHDIILAEGLPVESYLDTGGRSAFFNDGTVVVLHPNFSARVWEAEGCAPLVVTGATVAAVKGGLATRAIINQQQRSAPCDEIPSRDSLASIARWTKPT